MIRIVEQWINTGSRSTVIAKIDGIEVVFSVSSDLTNRQIKDYIRKKRDQLLSSHRYTRTKTHKPNIVKRFWETVKRKARA